MNKRNKVGHIAWQPVKTVSQIVFLILFVVLTMKGKIQLWFGLFIVTGLLGSMVFGRIYCSGVCPMGTLMRAQSWIYRKLHIKRFRTPSWMKNTAVRVVFLLLSFGTMFVMQLKGIKFPFLPAYVGLSLLVSLFFEEALWHHWLCPFGTMLSVTSRPSSRGMYVTGEACIGCGACERVCTTHCIDIADEESRNRVINKSECVGCRNCENICPTGAIKYQKISR